MHGARDFTPSAGLIASLPIVLGGLYLGGFVVVAYRLNLDRLAWSADVFRVIGRATESTQGSVFALTYLWGTACVIFGMLLLLTIGFGLITWWQTIRPWMYQPVALRWLWILVLMGVAVAALNPKISSEVRVSSGGRPATQLKLVLEHALNEPKLHLLTEIETRLTYVALGFLAVACSSLVLSSVAAAGNREILLARIRRTHGLLHVATACLVTGVAQVFLLYTWPAQFLPESSRQAVAAFAKGLALTAGTNYTALLLAIFLPLLLMQRRLALQTARPPEATSTATPAGMWLLGSELDQSFADRMKTWGALLAPLATSLLSLLSSG
jgi:hypothetical protein